MGGAILLFSWVNPAASAKGTATEQGDPSTEAQTATIASLRDDTVQLVLSRTEPYVVGTTLLLRKPGVGVSTGESVLIRVLESGETRLTGRFLQPDIGASLAFRVGDQIVSEIVEAREATTREGGEGEEPSQSGPSIRVSVTAIKGDRVGIAAGEDLGIQTGMTLGVFEANATPRDQRVAALKIDEVGPAESWGIASGEAASRPLRVGYEALVPVGPGTKTPATEPKETSKSLQKPIRSLPASGPELVESKGKIPHYSVPRTDRVYALLGSLAADGLIRSYPARVFFDDALLRHKPDEDLILTRSQIVAAIAEALDRAFDEEGETTPQQLIALQLLVMDYRADLQSLGYLPSQILKTIATTLKPAINVGVSGYARAAHLSRSGIGSSGEPEDVKQPLTSQTPGTHLDIQADMYSLLPMGFQFFGRFNDQVYSEKGDTQLRRATLTKTVNKRLQLEAGRGDFWWGPGAFGTLMLSDAGGPYDYLKTQWRHKRLLYEGFSAVIQNSPLQRNLYAHRVEYALSPEVRLGVAETMTVPGDGMDPVLTANALVPFLPFYEIDLVRDFSNDNNKVSAVYAEASPTRGFTIYTELLIDDFIVRRSESSPHRLGQLFGMYLFDPEGPHRRNLRMEFARTDPGVYLPVRVEDPYFVDGLPIGYPTAVQDNRAAGFQDIRLEGNYLLFPRLTLGGGIEVADFGQDRPVLSRQQIYRARATYDLSQRSSIALRYRSSSTTNPGFTVGSVALEQALSLEFMTAF